jgi:hypothetical protein
VREEGGEGEGGRTERDEGGRRKKEGEGREGREEHTILVMLA